MTNMYLRYAGGWVAIDCDLPEVQAELKFEGWMYYDPDLFLLED